MKALTASLALAAAAAMVLVGGAPALAAGNSIDPGDALYALPCDTEAYNDWQLMSVDASTAAATTIGTGAGSVSDAYYACAAQPAYDASTGRSYYIQWHDTLDEEEFPHFYLAEVTVATGVSTTIGEFTEPIVESEDLYPAVQGIAIGLDGAAYALADGDLYSLDLATAELTLVGPSVSGGYAFAVDPVSGIFYAITYDDEDDDVGDPYTNSLYSIDTSDGSFVDLGEVETSFGAEGPGPGIFSLQIDGGGTFWAQFNDSSTSGSGLLSFTLSTTATPVYSGPFVDGPFYSEAILIIPGEVPTPPKPQLAATGVEAGPGAAVAAVLALVGLTLLATRRRRAA